MEIESQPELPPLSTGPLTLPDGESAEERRVVTILFADLVDSTTLADGIDAEELRTLLAIFFALMAERIRWHGGTVEKFIGDAIMGIFGLPRAHEDDPARAIRAAIDMQQALTQLNAERRAADSASPLLQMRIGINTGDVIAATGPAEGRDFLITGDPVNVAARLQQVAEPGTVLVGPRTYRYTQGIVEYRALSPVLLKGKPRPIRVWQALSMIDTSPVPLARSRSLDPPSTPFVGRDVEISLMNSLYARVVNDRQPHVITILGVPGIGKTRLAREFTNQISRDVSSPTLLSGRCALYGEGITFWPIIEMLHNFSGITSTTPPELAQAKIADCVRRVFNEAGLKEDPLPVANLLGYTIGFETQGQQLDLPADPKLIQIKLGRAWQRFFEAIATYHPLILMIDDIQWADDALLALLDFIVLRSSGKPILIICTARTEILQRRIAWGTGKRNYTTLGLEPLNEAQSNQMLDAFLDYTILPAELRINVLQRAEGNPFFIEEIVRMLIERGVLIEDDDCHWQVSEQWKGNDEALDPVIPDTIQGVVAARLDLLTPDERDVLSHAAVIGRTFWANAVISMTSYLPREHVDAILHELVTKGLIAPVQRERRRIVSLGGDEQQYTFTHIMTRDVAYDTIPRARRAHEHEQFAEWLKHFAAGRESQYAEPLALHYEEYYRQAGLARSRNVERRREVCEKVVHYIEIAGDEARKRYAIALAINLYTRAIVLLRDQQTPERILMTRLLRKRGDVRTLGTDGDGAWSDFRAALQRWLVDDKGQTRSLDEMAQLNAEERRTGMRLYRRLVLLPARYPSWFHHIPPSDELHAYLDAGLRLAEQSGSEDSLDRISLLTAKTFYWWSNPQKRGPDDIKSALDAAEEAVELAERKRAPRHASEALDALGNMQAMTTNLVGYLKSQVRRLYWARRIDDHNEIIDIHCEVSSAHQMVGEYAQAIEHAKTALRMAEEIDNSTLQGQALQRLVIAYYEQDSWPETIADGERLIAIGPRTTLITQNHYRWGVLAFAIALARTGQKDRLDHVIRTLTLLPPVHYEAQYVQVFRARLLLAQGEYSEPESILQAALENTAGRHSYPALLAELAELGARQGRRDLTEKYGQRAVMVGERSGARKPYAQALRARGLVALSDGHMAEARQDLENALERFIQLETHWEEARTRYALAGWWRRQPEQEFANAELIRALQLFENCGAVRDIARARAALAGGEVRLP
jgi:class 3 adenylate cyclase/tetratricopeptide (TPR) repeat protein